VLHHADRPGLLALAREIQRLAEGARAHKLKLEELQGGTFTVTSTGAKGGVLATPIIHHPQVAILGVHEVKKKPAVVSGAIVARDLGNLSLALDHRVVDGATGRGLPLRRGRAARASRNAGSRRTTRGEHAHAQVLDPEGRLAGPDPAIPRDEPAARLPSHAQDAHARSAHALAPAPGAHRLLRHRHRRGGGDHRLGDGAARHRLDLPALRQTGVSLWRGTTVKEIVCQLIGNAGDVLIGRQMPCHFSDRKVRSVAWSSVIGTQLVHAMGAAWGGEDPARPTT
jgi:hypothetical protein